LQPGATAHSSTGHRSISADGRPLGPDYVAPFDGEAHLALLRRNQIAMHATVLYRRDCLLEMCGFDETLRLCEDYDMYLRIVQRYPIASHPVIVAEYRRHGENISNDFGKMYVAMCVVLDRHAARISDPAALAVLEEGRANGRNEFARRCHAAGAAWLARRDIRKSMSSLAQGAGLSPLLTLRLTLGSLRRRISQTAPPDRN
jgi:hypothetical protein